MRESTRRHFNEVAALPEPTPEAKPTGRVRVIVLASGSEGNSTLIALGDRAIVIDAGITPDEGAKRARLVGYPIPHPLDAVLLTHWHKDHSRYASRWCKDFRCPLVCSGATLLGLETQPPHRRANPGEVVDRLDSAETWEIHPIKVSHEEGSLAFYVRVGGKNIVFAHDLGEPSSSLLGAVRAADCLLIEANHETSVLLACQDPGHTQDLHARITSLDRGHLSNALATAVVGQVDPSRIQMVCGLHLSSSHNTEALAEAALRAGIPPGASPYVYVARQDAPLLIEVNGGPKAAELSVLDQFRILDRKVDSIIGEQKRANAETSERRAVLGEYMVEMEQLFQSKEDGTKLNGHEFFTNWSDSKAAQMGVSPRMMFHYYRDARVVVPLLGRETTRSLPMGTASELAKYAQVKGSIPAEILQFAQEHPAHEVRAHVAAQLYPGNSGHFDGPAEYLTITAGKQQIAHLRKMLSDARTYVSAEAPDAEVLEYALHDFIESKRSEARMETAPDIPLPPDFGDLAEIIADGKE